MDKSSASDLRNIGILAHIDAGKTSLTERILFVSGRIRAPGAVDEGTTSTDFLSVERERGITVKAAATRLEWRRGGRAIRLNLIDTPGHVDFGSEVERSLRALDGAIVLLCAVAGVQSRTETLYRACKRRGAARLVFVNKMDRRGASFERASEDFVRILDPLGVPVQIPWGEGEGFRGVVDLVDMLAYDLRAGGQVPLPPELEAPARQARERLVEAAASAAGEAEAERHLMEDYVAGREIGKEGLRAALRSQVLSGRIVPILCGGAFYDGSAALLLDAVADYLPSPGEATMPEGIQPSTGLETRREGLASPFSALVFKTSVEPHFGRLSWTRLWSGSIKAGDRILDARAGRTTRVQKLFALQADRIEAVETADAGDIVAIALAPSAAAADLGGTGATLCDPDAPIVYEPIRFEEPVVSLAVEPRTRADGERLREGMAAIVEDDPSLRVSEDPLTGRFELSGMGELHLEVAVERLSKDYGARVRAGRPRVAFKECLMASAEGREDFDRDLGGERVRASVALRVSPGSRGSGLVFAAELADKAPAALLEAARRGVEASFSVGPAAGFPLDDVEVALTELGPPKSSSRGDRAFERAVEIAASLAANKASRAAASTVLEPVMRLEVDAPEENLGEAVAAVSRRGGRIESVEDAPGGMKLIVGAAPLRSLFGFAGELRSVSGGRASYSARFHGYEGVPPGFHDFL